MHERGKYFVDSSYYSLSKVIDFRSMTEWASCCQSLMLIQTYNIRLLSIPWIELLQKSLVCLSCPYQRQTSEYKVRMFLACQISKSLSVSPILIRMPHKQHRFSATQETLFQVISDWIFIYEIVFSQHQLFMIFLDFHFPGVFFLSASAYLEHRAYRRPGLLGKSNGTPCGILRYAS